MPRDTGKGAADLSAAPFPILLQDAQVRFAAPGEGHPCQDYVELVLEDNAPVMLAAERLRPSYPNLLSVSNRWMAATVTGERAAKLKGQNERTVLTSFLKEVCGTEAEPQDLALFQEVLEELRAE